MQLTCLNDVISWNGTSLGEFPNNVILEIWKAKNIDYWKIIYYHNGIPGFIVCNYKRTNSKFALIVENIKPIFKIQRQGLYHINIGGKNYIIYYVPITLNDQIILETPLLHIGAKDLLRIDIKIITEVRRIIAFSEILSLCNANEGSIVMRLSGENLIPISDNTNSTALKRINAVDQIVISKTLYNKWYNENITFRDVLAEVTDIYELGTEKSNIIFASIRKQIDDIIKMYDIGYIWYTSFIMDKLTEHLANY